MPRGPARPGPSAGENIQHFNAVRLRVVGSGILRSTLYSLDDTESQALANLTMQATTNRQPTLLANFIQQRASLKIETTAIDEYVRINRIIIFQKELWTSYPQ